MAQNTPTQHVSWRERFKNRIGQFIGQQTVAQQHTLTPVSNALPVQQSQQAGSMTPLDEERVRFERAAQELEQFDDGKVEVEQWFKRKYVLFFAIVAPLVLTYWLGYENGYAFSGRDYNWTNKVVMANYWIGYAIEGAIVAVVYVMAWMNRRKKKGEKRDDLVRVFCFWLVGLIASGAIQLRFLAMTTPHPFDPHTHLPTDFSPLDWAIMSIRVGFCCLIDVICALVLVWPKKTVEKKIEELEQKADALLKLARAHITLEQAWHAAERERKQDAQYKKEKEERHQTFLELERYLAEELVDRFKGRRVVDADTDEDGSNQRKSF